MQDDEWAARRMADEHVRCVAAARNLGPTWSVSLTPRVAEPRWEVTHGDLVLYPVYDVGWAAELMRHGEERAYLGVVGMGTHPAAALDGLVARLVAEVQAAQAIVARASTVWSTLRAKIDERRMP